MDPNLVLHLEECRKSELCESRVFSLFEGGRFFQMQAYDDPQKYVGLLWSFEVLTFAPTADALSAKAVDNSTVLQQTLAQTLVRKTVAIQKKTNLDSIDIANDYIEKKVIPRVLFSVEKFTKDGGIEYDNNISLQNVSITQFKGKYLKTPNAGALDLVVFSFKDYK